MLANPLYPRAADRSRRAARLSVSRQRPEGRGRRSQAGAMLLEVLIGLVIFMIGALGLMGYVGRATADSVDARVRAQAALLSQQYFARLDAVITTDARGANLATYQAAVSSVAPTLCSEWTTDTLNAASVGIPNATASCEVVPTDESVHVRLTISWSARGGASAEPGYAGRHQFVTQRPII